MSIYGNVYDNIYGELDEEKKKKKPTTYFNATTPTFNLYASSSDNNQLGGYGDKISNVLTPAIKGTSQYVTSGKTPWGAIGSVGKQSYNMISDKDDKDYSDLEESIIYPLQGTSMGASFGPVGALAGALYGLGYSFKDDLGMKDSNFLTQLLFPIGMGDGGGLRIGNKPILDLG